MFGMKPRHKNNLSQTSERGIIIFLATTWENKNDHVETTEKNNKGRKMELIFLNLMLKLKSKRLAMCVWIHSFRFSESLASLSTRKVTRHYHLSHLFSPLHLEHVWKKNHTHMCMQVCIDARTCSDCHNMY